MPQAKSRTFKSKKKSSILNRTTILVGVIVVAIIGIAAVFVSNASGEESAAFQQDIYCNQGKCAATPFAGAQKTQAFVRLSNKCATNQQWAAKKTKSAAKWVCLERVTSTQPVPSGFVAATNDCYTIPLPTGFTVSQPRPSINGRPNNCLGTVNYPFVSGQNDLTSFSITTFADINQNYRQAAATMKTTLANTMDLKYENNNYNLGGKKAIAQIYKNKTNNDKSLQIFTDTTFDLNGQVVKGLRVDVPLYSQTVVNVTNGVDLTRGPTIIADQILNNWKWGPAVRN